MQPTVSAACRWSLDQRHRCDVTQSLAGIEPSERFVALEAIELELGSELDAGGDRALAPLLDAALDQLPR
jgi:hypothetical protein